MLSDNTPVLIQDWLPIVELSIESRRERAASNDLPALYYLQTWWARVPLVVSAGVVLGSLLPAWSATLADCFRAYPDIESLDSYHAWYLRLCGILGDPVKAAAIIASDRATSTKSGDAYGYKKAFKNIPSTADLDLLHSLFVHQWGTQPVVLDPTAGGGSIPFSAVRYGLPVFANDLNPVAVSALRTGVDIPMTHGCALTPDLEKWGSELVRRVVARLSRYFKASDRNYIYARTVSCPRTGKPVPLSPNWWLSKARGGTAVRLLTTRNGIELESPAFEIATGQEINFNPDNGTVAGGDAVSPWDGLIIPGEYIKDEARLGRMSSILYAVVVSGTDRNYRAPTPEDYAMLTEAEAVVERSMPEWLRAGFAPHRGLSTWER